VNPYIIYIKNLSLLIFLFLLIPESFSAFAQHVGHDHEDEIAIRNCATMEQDSILREKFPQLGTLDDFERALQSKILEIQARSELSRTTAEIVSIPIIVHVVHNGEQVGQGTNISAAQVQAQIEVLNEDFRRMAGTNGFNTSPVGADIEIEFCLAALDQNGNVMAEPGIHRYNGRRATWVRNDIEGILKPATNWDPNRYYNIWTVSLGGEDERILGYAQFPSQSGLPGIPVSGGPAATDGVVVSYRQFGSSDKGNFPVMQAPYNKGRTLTHETGHWLGLRHIWGDGGCGADDFVTDTPESDQPNRGCPQGRVSCGSVDMVQNYMDYTDDGCMNIFTQGQKTRMRAVMELSPRRGSLTTSNVCLPSVAEGPPVPNFEAENRTILRGAVVNFVDLSSNFPTQWEWTFEGGDPSTSRDRNPSVRYDNSGNYTVSLKAINAFGEAVAVKEDYIFVSDAGICGEISNFGEGTPVVLRTDTVQGFVAGHNSLKHQAKAEFFPNSLGYTNLSSAFVRFGHAYTTRDDATVTVTVWNARGPQSSPGAVLERKRMLYREIMADVENGNYTEVIFERNVPLFGRGFYVGIELSYEHEDSIALVTTQDGEATQGTAWELNEEGEWEPYFLSWPLNVAHDITPLVGMLPSTQIFSSALIINAGESVNLNARGASIFSWEPDDGTLSATLGPQITVQPYQTTTYTVTGSGVDLCNETASITIFVNAPTAIEEEFLEKQLNIYPNPGNGHFTVFMSNELTGPVDIVIYNMLGEQVQMSSTIKNSYNFEYNFNISNMSNGMYIARFTIGNKVIKKRVVKF
jgi:PKD repeat protein